MKRMCRIVDEATEADFGGDDFAAERGGGLEHVGWLFGAEGDGDVGADGGTGDGSCIAVDAGWHVDRDDLCAGGVHLLDGEGGLSFERARETSAEEAVEHDVVRGKAHVFEWLARARQRVERVGAFGRAVAVGGQIVEPDIAAKVAKTLGGHEGVAAIVAGAGEDDDAAFGELCMQDVGAGLPCFLHKRPERYARLDGALLGGADFVAGEDGEGHVCTATRVIQRPSVSSSIRLQTILKWWRTSKASMSSRAHMTT